MIYWYAGGADVEASDGETSRAYMPVSPAREYPMNDQTKLEAAFYTLIAIIVYWVVFLPSLVAAIAKAAR